MGFLNATEVADYLVLKGMPFRDAHGLVGSILLYCHETNKAIMDLGLRELNRFSDFFDKSIYEYTEYAAANKNTEQS